MAAVLVAIGGKEQGREGVTNKLEVIREEAWRTLLFCGLPRQQVSRKYSQYPE